VTTSLSHDLVGSTAGLLASAFHHEPVTRWLVPDESDRETVMTHFFTLVLEEAITAGEVDVLPDSRGEPQVAAVWFDRTDPSALAGDDAAADPRLEAIFGPWADRWRVVEELLARSHPVTPHHHLMFIGVRPRRQGCGLGSALLRARHERLDRAGIPAYLESTSPASSNLYARCGYLSLGEALVLPSGPVIRPMWRPVGRG
jgi:GNAT superfamily N-acetyltransferase